MILSDDYIEIEDFLPLELQDKVLQELIHPSFPWGMTLNSVYGGGSGELTDDAAVGFFHTFMFNGEQKSPDLPLVSWIMNGFEDAVYGRVQIKEMERIRGGLFTKHPSDVPHPPHVDSEKPHWTAVYYVNDCDGDFVLYNQTHPEYKNEYRVDNSGFTVKKRCKVAKGKLVAFNGKHFHSSSFPNKKPFRMAITFNFTVY